MKQTTTLLIVCFLFFISSVVCQLPYNNLRKIGVYKDPRGYINIEWGVPDDDDTRLYFNVTATTTGWVGIGFNNPGKFMPGADFAVCFFNEAATVSDMFTTGYREPTPDVNTNDILLHEASQLNGFSNFLISRKKQTLDYGNDYPIRDEYPLQLLYAIGQNENFKYHIHRDSFTVNLSSGIIYDYSQKGWDGNRVGFYHSDDHDFELEWGFSGKGDDEYIIWKVKAKTEGWFALGLSRDHSMPNTDMMVMVVEDRTGDDDEDNPYRGWVTDRYVGDDYEQPKMDVKQDVTVLYADQHDGYSYMAIARKVKTGDIQDRNVDDTDHLLWAMGRTDSFHIHYKKGWSSVDWRDGGNSNGGRLPLAWIHGMLMIFAWMFLAFISTGLTRYCKSLQGAAWIYVHAFLFLLVVFFSIVAFILIVIEVSLNPSSTGHFDNYHKIAGLILFVLTLIQPLVVLLFKLPVLSDKIREANATAFMIGLAQHRYFGYLLFVFAIVNVGTGLALYSTQTGIWICFGIWVGVICAYWFILEILSIVPGFNEIVGKMGGNKPKNILANGYAFMVALCQVFVIVFISILFAIIIVLFAVYKSDYDDYRF